FEPTIGSAANVGEATGQAHHRAANTPNPRELAPATRAVVGIRSRASPNRKGKAMASLFVADSEIDARAAPFRAVWPDPLSPSSKLRQQMGELMTHRSVDLLLAMFKQERV